MQRAPSRHKSTASQSKPITIFECGEGSRKSTGSCDAFVTTWIGTRGSSSSTFSPNSSSNYKTVANFLIIKTVTKNTNP